MVLTYFSKKKNQLYLLPHPQFINIFNVKIDKNFIIFLTKVIIRTQQITSEKVYEADSLSVRQCSTS